MNHSPSSASDATKSTLKNEEFDSENRDIKSAESKNTISYSKERTWVKVINFCQKLIKDDTYLNLQQKASACKC